LQTYTRRVAWTYVFHDDGGDRREDGSEFRGRVTPGVRKKDRGVLFAGDVFQASAAGVVGASCLARWTRNATGLALLC
jgi:hypothetical protein